jgi:hypothetical protein
MDLDAKAAIDSDGFGGHTALFATLVWQPNLLDEKPQVAPFTELLLDHGALQTRERRCARSSTQGTDRTRCTSTATSRRGPGGERFHRKIFLRWLNGFVLEMQEKQDAR